MVCDKSIQSVNTSNDCTQIRVFIIDAYLEDGTVQYLEEDKYGIIGTNLYDMHTESCVCQLNQNRRSSIPLRLKDGGIVQAKVDILFGTRYITDDSSISYYSN